MAPMADLPHFHSRSRIAGVAASTTWRAWWLRQNSMTCCCFRSSSANWSDKPVHLDHQHGGGIGRKAEVECLFDRRQDPLVHSSMAVGMMPAAIICVTAADGVVDAC